MLYQEWRKLNYKNSLSAVFLVSIFTIITLTSNAHALKEVNYNKNWIENPDFSVEDHWNIIQDGDNTDVNGTIHSGQGNFEICGSKGNFSLIADPPLAIDWVETNNPKFPNRPDLDEITSYGCRVSHEFNDSTAVQNPSVHWDHNITLPIDMEDYVIKSASIHVIVNATVDDNLDREEDYLTGDLARWNPNYDVDTYSIGDYARFYVLISDLEKNKVYEIAHFQTEQIGTGDPPGKDYLFDTNMLSVPQDVLIFYLESILGSNSQNFTISLGIDIYSEDNVADYWDLDNFDELIIKFVNFSFSFEKVINRYTSISLCQVGESIDEANIKIRDANLNFKFKIDKTWPETLSPNSELKIFINNYEIGRNMELSEMNSTYQTTILRAADIKSYIFTNINISLSIMIYLADNFALDEKITISIDEVYLMISYTVLLEDSSLDFIILMVLIILFIIIAILGSLSLRSYVFMPRKKKRENYLLLRTQRFKDISNIQAIIIMHKDSGLPIFTESYSYLMKGKNTLFSGFIQAISVIGEEISKNEPQKLEIKNPESKLGYKKIIELDLKQFFCLVLDFEELRTVLILKNKSSKRLKQYMYQFTMTLYMRLSKFINNWDNDLAYFNKEIPPFINEFFEIFYKNAFKASFNAADIPKLRKKYRLSKMEIILIKKIVSILKDNSSFLLMTLIEELGIKEEDLVINAIESLIEKKIIVPISIPINN
ncbi:MAG: hypothetical protein ACFFC9_00430 [Promethearchaeota archaeon]